MQSSRVTGRVARPVAERRVHATGREGPCPDRRKPLGTQVRMTRLPPQPRLVVRPGWASMRSGAGVEQVHSHGDLRTSSRASWPRRFLHPRTLSGPRHHPASNIRPFGCSRRLLRHQRVSLAGLRFSRFLPSGSAAGAPDSRRALAQRAVPHPGGSQNFRSGRSFAPSSSVHIGVHEGRHTFSSPRGDESP